MWEHRCTAVTRRGSQCKRRSTQGVYCFGFQGEHYRHASWVEVCGHHATDCQGYVASLSIRKP